MDLFLANIWSFATWAGMVWCKNCHDSSVNPTQKIVNYSKSTFEIAKWLQCRISTLYWVCRCKYNYVYIYIYISLSANNRWNMGTFTLFNKNSRLFHTSELQPPKAIGNQCSVAKRKLRGVTNLFTGSMLVLGIDCRKMFIPDWVEEALYGMKNSRHAMVDYQPSAAEMSRWKL